MLYLASIGDYSLDAVRFLVESGVDLDVRDDDGWTPPRQAEILVAIGNHSIAVLSERGSY